jgi:hypothetical protein
MFPFCPAGGGVDLLLLGLFAIWLCIMARSGFKRWSAQIFPVACLRST